METKMIQVGYQKEVVMITHFNKQLFKNKFMENALEKKKQVLVIEDFIANYNGSLVIKKGCIYDGDILVATFTGNKVQLKI